MWLCVAWWIVLSQSVFKWDEISENIINKCVLLEIVALVEKCVKWWEVSWKNVLLSG